MHASSNLVSKWPVFRLVYVHRSAHFQLKHHKLT